MVFSFFDMFLLFIGLFICVKVISADVVTMICVAFSVSCGLTLLAFLHGRRYALNVLGDSAKVSMKGNELIAPGSFD